MTSLLTSSVNCLVEGGSRVNFSSLTISKSMSSLSHRFSMTLNDLSRDYPIAPGVRISFHIGTDVGDELGFNGFVDSVAMSVSPRGTSLVCSGRSKTQDAEDCSAEVDGSGRLSGLTVGQICRRLCAQYNIIVDIVKDSPPIPEFVVNPGETIYQAVLRISRPYGILPISNENGEILMIGTSDFSRAVTYKINSPTSHILSATRATDHSSRFSEYIIKSQSSGGAISIADRVNELSGTQRQEKEKRKIPVGSSRDSGVKRRRRLVEISDTPLDSDTINNRAKFTRNYARGNSDTMSVSLKGHLAPNGSFYRLGDCVTADIPGLRLSDNIMYIVESISTSYDAMRGSDTKLTLRPPTIFDISPVPSRGGAASGQSSEVSVRVSDFTQRISSAISDMGKLFNGGEND